MEYFYRDINLIIINYLNSEKLSLKLLKILKIQTKYYTSKKYHIITRMDKVRYKINKVIVSNVNQLNKITDNYKNKIMKLKFMTKFDQKIDRLPKNMCGACIGHENIHKCTILPKNLTHLTFGRYFNQKIDNLPKNLICLTFGYSFNQSVNNLPNSITYLTFGHYFNQEVSNLPQSLTHLTFGHYFNQSVDNLPNNIINLKFGYCFNQEINNLPKQITHLRIGLCYSRETNLERYKELVEAIMVRHSQKHLFKNIPKNCKIRYSC